MQHPNENGVYTPELTKELARRGRSYVQAEIALCQDGLFHFSISIQCSDRGSGGPITTQTPGFTSAREAEDAALREAVSRFGEVRAHEAEGIRRELLDLRAQLERPWDQPLLL